MRIVGINGVWSIQNPIWKNLETAFRRHFPVTGFVVKEDAMCHPWEVKRLHRFADHIVQNYDDGEETLLVGHSMGGVVACAIAHRFRHSHVRGIVTIFAPHRFLGGVFARALDVPGQLIVPLISFSGRYDELVWWGANHPQSAKHIVLNSNHFTDLIFVNRLTERIAYESKLFFFPKA